MKTFWEAILTFFKTLFGKKPVVENTTNNEPISNENDTIVNNEVYNEPIDEPNNDTNGDTNNDTNEPNLGQSGEQVSNDCKIVILIDNGHGSNTPGKKSPYSCYGVKPEIEFYEYKWNREIATEIHKRLVALGYDARIIVPEIIDISLKERVNRVNKICTEVGTQNVILLSVHANAAGNGREWKTARGWCAFTTKGTTKSDAFAECLYDEAKKNFVGHQIRMDKTDGDSDWESNFYIIYHSYCPAVLTENFFYDNVEDVKYILSAEGREMVIKTHVDGIIKYLKSIKK